MQSRGSLTLLATLALFQLAAAQPPGNTRPQPAASAQSLGAALGVFDFCSKVDPQHEEQYERQGERLFRGMGDKTVEQLRNSAAFRDARRTLESVLSELPLDQVRAACKDAGSGMGI
jgi:hypothetical protein